MEKYRNPRATEGDSIFILHFMGSDQNIIYCERTKLVKTEDFLNEVSNVLFLPYLTIF
jgi:hypothetical protein